MKHQYTNEQMKGLFYLNKIATLLFPGKVATVRIAGNSSDDDGVIRSQFRTAFLEQDLVHQSMQHHTKVFNGTYEADTHDEEASLDQFFELYSERTRLLADRPDVQAFLAAYRDAGFENKQAVISEIWGAQDVILDDNNDFTYVDVDIPWDEPREVGQTSHTPACLRFDPIKLQTAINSLDDATKVKAQVYYDRLMELAKEAGFVV